MTPPLNIISIENGCEGYSAYTYIPATSELTSSMDTSTHHHFFIAFNDQYQTMPTYGIWFELQLESLTKQEKETLGIKLPEFPPMVLAHMKHCIKHIDTNYP